MSDTLTRRVQRLASVGSQIVTLTRGVTDAQPAFEKQPVLANERAEHNQRVTTFAAENLKVNRYKHKETLILKTKDNKSLDLNLHLELDTNTGMIDS